MSRTSLFLFTKYTGWFHGLLLALALAYKKGNKNVWWCPVLVLSSMGIVPMTIGAVGRGTGVIVVLCVAFSFLVLFTYSLYGKKKITIGMMPTGTPMYMAFLIFLIEIVRYMIRPITLSLRILINLRVGHIFLGFGGRINGVVGSGLLIVYEFCVVAVQVAILVTLIRIYKG